MLRDQALAVSGLLVEKIGGPSVKPYQPRGLWEIAMGKPKYDQGKGDDLHRRSLYTFWKRTVPPPAMMTFDAADRSYLHRAPAEHEHAAAGARVAERHANRRSGAVHRRSGC